MTEKPITLKPVSKNPTSVRLDEDDEKALKQAMEIIRKKFATPGLKLNPSNVFRIVLHEFVKREKEPD